MFRLADPLILNNRGPAVESLSAVPAIKAMNATTSLDSDMNEDYRALLILLLNTFGYNIPADVREEQIQGAVGSLADAIAANDADLLKQIRRAIADAERNPIAPENPKTFSADSPANQAAADEQIRQRFGISQEDWNKHNPPASPQTFSAESGNAPDLVEQVRQAMHPTRTPDEEAIRQRFGISEEDWNKHNP